jgi:hypothetical protein
MLRFGQILTLFFVFVVSPSFSATQIYSYKDDSGTANFTTELDSIPEKYRDRAIPLDSESSSTVGSAVQTPPPAAVRVVTASGEYRMGDHDTRADAVRLAIEAAKRQALEEVATYLESVTEVRDMDVTRDDIRTYTAGVVMVLNQQVSTRLEGETVVIQADLTAQVDPNEVAQAITALRDNESAKQGDKVKCWVCSLLGIALPDGPCCMSETLTPSSSVPSEREERWSTVSPTTRC